MLYRLFIKYHYFNKEEKKKFKESFNKIKYDYIKLSNNNKITNYVMKFKRFNVIVFYFKIVLVKNKLSKFLKDNI